MVDISPYFNVPNILEYTPVHGGKWYYTQDKPGTAWFDTVSNTKGWTVDFNLTVESIENSDRIDSFSTPDGIGIYVNDGSRYESIYFLTQEIIFTNAKEKIVYDTTTITDYRLTGKENNLTLFARGGGNATFSKIAEVYFGSDSTNQGSGRKPSVFEDSSGNLHTVWYDDGNLVGQLYYAKLSAGEWSAPELIFETNLGAQYPDISVGTNGNIYVTYESYKGSSISIGFVYKTDLGWSETMEINTDAGDAKRPCITLDSNNNAVVAWEDYRHVHPEIYDNIWLQRELKWQGETRLTTTTYGCYNPSITSYLDRIFISWTERSINNTSKISMLYHDIQSGTIASSTDVSDVGTFDHADYSDILSNVAGKIFIVWHDNVDDFSYDIYGRIYTYDMSPLISINKITLNTNGKSKYPNLSEQNNTGDVYIVWQDSTTPADFTHVPDPYDPYYFDPYREDRFAGINRRILVAYYNNNQDRFYSSGNNSFDVIMTFTDERNPSFPSVPDAFNSELPIFYEALMGSYDNFLPNASLFTQIRHAYYDLTRDSTTFLVQNTPADSGDPYSVSEQKDFLVNGYYLRKEIRFGDFSNTLSTHAVFGEIKYYTSDAVDPLSISEVSEKVFDESVLAVSDALVNNHGDCWMVGSCGTLFYSNRLNALYDMDTIASISGSFRVVSFDNNNHLFIGGFDESGSTRVRKLYYSVDHLTNYYEIEVSGVVGDGTLGEVTAFAFDKDNRMYLGTKEAGAYIITLPNLDDNPGESNAIGTKVKDLTTSSGDLPNNFVTSIKIDENNVAWIGTRAGLTRYHQNVSRIYRQSNGMPSSRVNDITIRNTAIRYIATSNGIAKMVGTGFELIKSEEGDIWNNNVKSVAWRDPNVLWAGTLSAINQIVVNDEDGTYNTTVFEPSDYSSFTESYDGLTIFYIISSDIEDMSSTERKALKNSLIEVYLNGNRISHGYDISFYPVSLIRFKTRLKETDVVDIVVRQDVKILASWEQSEAEKQAIGARLIRISDIAATPSDLYITTLGDDNDIKINDSTSSLPYDRIHLDQTPPTGKISSIEQISRSIVNVTLSDVTDGEYGSGVENMVISNYENFTTDGIVSETPVPYVNISSHDLGLAIDTSSQMLDLGSATGSVIEIFEGVSGKELYAGTSLSATVRQYNFVTNEWTTLFTYGSSEYVDFIVRYNSRLIIGVGSGDEVAKLYVYDYEYDQDGNFTGFSSPKVIPLSESRAYAAVVMNNILYIGSGPGPGDEYGVVVGTVGRIYSFDGLDLLVVVEGIDMNVYSLTTYNNSLFAGTGEQGRIYRIDPVEQTAIIVHTDSDSGILSLEHLMYSDVDYIFAGVSSEGKILRSSVTSFSFDTSFKTTPTSVTSLKKFTSGTSEILYAAVGRILYNFGEGGSWLWDYTHGESIQDFTWNDANDTIYIISSSNITKIEPLTQTKLIYLKLIDRAGNETSLYNSQGAIKPDLTYAIDISTLKGFINENKIFELDENGSVISTFTGDSPFYSAGKVEEEKGVYESEVFDGTNDLVKWDNMYWEATEPANTKVYMYIRTDDSATDILTVDWIGPYEMNEAMNVDLGFLSGQFIQFKVELISYQKDLTPSFSRATIRAMTSESIHFFTTNFVLDSSPTKGILTSQKLVPVAADVVFGINTTNSVDWTEYQIIDEDRLFNVTQTGSNMRIGIKLVSPARTAYEAPEFDEYGPYNTNLFVNTIDFNAVNNTGVSQNYHFRVRLFEDFAMTTEVYNAFSRDNQDGFSTNEDPVAQSGVAIADGSSARILFSVPAAAGIRCNTFYFLDVETVYEEGGSDVTDTVLTNYSYIGGCSASFVDTIEFEFSNTTAVSHNYHFRIKFFTNAERTNELVTEFSGNDRTGWFANDVQIPEAGITINQDSSANILYRPDLTKFENSRIYYITIDAFDGSSFLLASNSYSFQARGLTSLVYCGEYFDVPIVKNFGLIFELENNEFMTLNA